MRCVSPLRKLGELFTEKQSFQERGIHGWYTDGKPSSGFTRTVVSDPGPLLEGGAPPPGATSCPRKPYLAEPSCQVTFGACAFPVMPTCGPSFYQIAREAGICLLGSQRCLCALGFVTSDRQRSTTGRPLFPELRPRACASPPGHAGRGLLRR